MPGTNSPYRRVRKSSGKGNLVKSQTLKAYLECLAFPPELRNGVKFGKQFARICEICTITHNIDIYIY